jgi:hypothetical protein
MANRQALPAALLPASFFLVSRVTASSPSEKSDVAAVDPEYDELEE